MLPSCLCPVIPSSQNTNHSFPSFNQHSLPIAPARCRFTAGRAKAARPDAPSWRIGSTGTALPRRFASCACRPKYSRMPEHGHRTCHAQSLRAPWRFAIWRPHRRRVRRSTRPRRHYRHHHQHLFARDHDSCRRSDRDCISAFEPQQAMTGLLQYWNKTCIVKTQDKSAAFDAATPGGKVHAGAVGRHAADRAASGTGLGRGAR
jgi:hypothetical protein